MTNEKAIDSRCLSLNLESGILQGEVNNYIGSMDEKKSPRLCGGIIILIKLRLVLMVMLHSNKLIRSHFLFFWLCL